MGIAVIFICVLSINFILYGSLAESYPPNILNIGDKMDTEIAYYYHQKHPGVSVSTYISNKENNVVKILDSAVLIWEAKYPGTRMSLLKVYRRHQLNKLAYLYTVTGSHYVTRYYERFRDVWFEISISAFQYKLNKLFRERYIDLKEPIDPSMYMVQNHDLYGLQATVIIPYTKYEIISVAYGYDILWEQKIGRGVCSCIIVHGKMEDAKLIHLHIKHQKIHGEIFMVNFNGNFEPVIKDYFYRVLNTMDTEENERLRKMRSE